MMKFFAVILACLVIQARSQPDDFQTRYKKAVDKIFSNERLLREFEATVNKDGSESISPVEFTCSPEPSNVQRTPRNVHELRPQDVGVVGVMGDSVNAGIGLGAENVFEVILENRGESFLGGGGKWSWGSRLEDNVITLPNILKKFNPDLKGWAYGIGFSTFRNARNNKAITGAKAMDLVEQAHAIIDEMKSDMASFENEWKIISIFIGGNDLCQSCEEAGRGQKGAVTGEEYSRHMQNAIDLLHEQVPKLYVNLVAMFDVTPLSTMRTGLVCDVLQGVMCDCPSYERANLRARQMDYTNKLTEMVNSGRFDTREDFTVVLQHHMRDSVPPKLSGSEKYDPSWLSFDCFHPARKLHQAMAILLWNTMMTNNHEKSFGVALDDTSKGYKCPTANNPFLYTKANSHPELDQVQALAARRSAKVQEETHRSEEQDAQQEQRVEPALYERKTDATHRVKNPRVLPEHFVYESKVSTQAESSRKNKVEKVKEYLRRSNPVDPFPAKSVN